MRRLLLASSAVLLMASPAMAQGAKDYAPGQQQTQPGGAKQYAPGQQSGPARDSAPGRQYRGTTGQGARDKAPGRMQSEPGGAKKFAPGRQSGPAKDYAPGRNK